MKKNEIFTFTTSNGIEVTAVAISLVGKTIVKDSHGFNSMFIYTWLCYAQNRLFTYKETSLKDEIIRRYGEILVEYAVLPKYDKMLEAEQQKFDDECYEALSSIGDVNF